MDKNTDDFLKGLERTEKRMIQDAEYQAKKFVSSLFNALLEPSPAGTPVVSGFMRSNWRIGLDSFDNSTVGTKKSVTYQPQESSFNALMRADLTNINTIYIYNNTPYIQTVNEGTAKQSPVLFVELSLDRGLRRAKA